MYQSIKFAMMGVVMLSISENIMSDEVSDYAKNLDYTPEVTSDAYWDTYHVCIVRVTKVGRDKAGKEQVTFEVTQQISEGPSPDTRTVLLSHFWFGPDIDERPRLEKNDSLVVFIKKKGRSQIAATKLDTPPEKSPLVKRLSRIAKLRANTGGIEALSEQVFDDDATVALYCLKRMATRSPVDVENYVSRLRDLRKKEAADVYVRLMASALANKLDSKPADSDEEYSWLRLAIARSKQKDWTQLAPLVDRLLDFEKKRSENVTFLSRLVQDDKNTHPVRIAAYGAFDDPRLFVFSNPKDASERIFEACISMLKDRHLEIRRAGAHLLQGICVKLAHEADPAVSGGYVDRAKASMAAAISVEKDEVCLYHIKILLERINQDAVPKP